MADGDRLATGGARRRSARSGDRSAVAGAARLATVAVAVLLRSGAAAQGETAWTALTPADATVPMSPNRLRDGGFELPPAESPWRPYGSGFAADAGRGGGQALRLHADAPGASHGAVQTVVLAQSEPRAIYVAGWSRASGVTGTADGDYSIYLDIYFADDPPLYGQRLEFAVGDHDWQRLERFVVPDRPIQRVAAYCLLRGAHGGTAWFDDLELREADADVASFDGFPVAVAGPRRPGPATVVRADRVSIELETEGGAVRGVSVDGRRIGAADRGHLGGVLVRDVAAGGPWRHVGGPVVRDGASLRQRSVDAAAGLEVDVSYAADGDGVAIRTSVASTTAADRAVSVYVALPLAVPDGYWHDARDIRPLAGRTDLGDFGYANGLGAVGYASRYPWAAVSGGGAGLALAAPPDEPRILRLGYSPTTGLLYAAFDLGLAPEAVRAPATAALRLLAVDAAWAFRDAARAYHDQHPTLATVRVPPERQGPWVAFSDIDGIPGIADFGIAFHELGGLGQVPFDDAHGILSFRYITEPWSHWLPIDEPGVDPAGHADVEAYLARRAARGDARSQATVASGFHDEAGRLVFRSTEAPWCRGAFGCAVFTVNPDPDVTGAGRSTNKARLEWNDEARAAYGRVGLDGEYVDSYLGAASTLDLRRAHLAAADTPPTFRTSDARVGTPEMFATTEFARWLAADIHDGLGRLMMANGILLDVPWGADLFDVFGTETNWLRDGRYAPESDARLLYRRALAGRRPYGLLMNTDFHLFGSDLVERYMRTSLFYGLYPSFFSHNAADERYWDDPPLYERDRALFRRYVPLVRRLADLGWRPVTRVRASDPGLLVERYGDWPDLVLAVRNPHASDPVTATLRIEAAMLGLPPWTLTATRLVAGGEEPVRRVDAASAQVEVALGPDDVELLAVSGRRACMPAAFR